MCTHTHLQFNCFQLIFSISCINYELYVYIYNYIYTLSFCDHLNNRLASATINLH